MPQAGVEMGSPVHQSQQRLEERLNDIEKTTKVTMGLVTITFVLLVMVFVAVTL